MSFLLFPPTQINLRPKFWHENDRKSEADLLIYKFKKMVIFDQKIIEVAIALFPLKQFYLNFFRAKRLLTDIFSKVSEFLKMSN